MNFPPLTKITLYDLPHPEGPEGEVIAPKAGEEGDSYEDGEHYRHEAGEDHGDRIKVVARVGEIMEPNDAGGIRPETEERVLSHAHLPRVSADEVPSLADGDVAEGHEEEIDDEGRFRVDHEGHHGDGKNNDQ